jgi:hypothetical protein
MFCLCEDRVLSDCCVGLITHREESYRVVCVCVCDREVLITRRL